MTNLDQDSLKAVEKAINPDKSYVPKDRKTLTELIQRMENLHDDLGQTIAHAKKVLDLILSGLK